MESYLSSIFEFDGNERIRAEDFNVSRIDIAVDIEDFPVDIILSIMP